MLVKFLGAAALVGGCFAVGKSNADKLSRRVRILMGLEEALLIFEGEMTYTLPEIKEALESASVCDISGVFGKSAGNTERFGAVNAFRKGVEAAGLDKEEKGALFAFATGLSSQDIEGQIKNAALCRERIRAIVKKAKEKKEKCEKLYTASGLLTGIAAVIMLL